MKERKKKAVVGARAVDESYNRWKDGIPLLYDWFTNHNLVWPTLCCRYASHLPLLSFSSSFSFLVILGFGSDARGFGCLGFWFL